MTPADFLYMNEMIIQFRSSLVIESLVKINDIKMDELPVYGFICKQVDFLVLLRRIQIDVFVNSQARTVQKHQSLCSQNQRKSAHVYVRNHIFGVLFYIIDLLIIVQSVHQVNIYQPTENVEELYPKHLQIFACFTSIAQAVFTLSDLGSL